MNYETYIALSVFAFISSITPGPNNIMLMSSGTNYGFQKTIPHLLGVSLGCGILILSACLGLIQLFDAYPLTYKIMNVICPAYLLYLTYKIATADPNFKNSKKASRPMNFIEAMLFQWMNPKAWTMAITAASLYIIADNLYGIIITTAIFTFIMLPCICVWAVLGQHITQWMTSTLRLKAFNYVMATSLLVTLLVMYI